MIFILFLLINFNLLCNGQENILLHKPVKVSEDTEKSKNLNDGDYNENCFNFDRKTVKWAVFDLEKVYQVQKLILWNTKVKSNISISFYVGTEFMPCKFHKQIQQYKLCRNDVTLSKQAKIEVNCQISGATGQFIAMVSGSFESYDQTNSFTICQVEAFGKLISTNKAKTRPEISSTPWPPLPPNYFEKIQRIRLNVTSVIVPSYSNAITFLNENCQPIIWTKDIQSTFGVACSKPDGKARLTVFGKNNFFKETLSSKDSELFASNLKRWMSPNLTYPTFIESKTLNSVEEFRKQVKNGSIIDLDVWNPMKEDIKKEVKKMWLKGQISINIDHTFWNEKSKEARKSYLEFLNVFHVDFTSTFVNRKKSIRVTFTEKDYNDDLLGVEEVLKRMTYNHEYLIKKGKDLIKTMKTIPNKFFSNSKIRSLLFLLVKKYSELLNAICPCKFDPAISSNDRLLLEIFGILFKSQALVNSKFKFPCIDLFPGDFVTPPKKENVTFVIQSETANTKNPIGYYLEPGSTLMYKVDEMNGRWSMSIGCHTDTLNDNRPEWYRYPNIHVNDIMIENEGSAFSPFGGTLWLQNNKANESIKLTITNIVPTPFFNVRDENVVKDWEKQRNNPGLWAQIAGDNMVICVESRMIRNLSGIYLKDLMRNNWDLLVKMDLSLKSVNWKSQRPEITVLDIMTSAGYGHSGYPISVYHDWFEGIFNMSLIEKKGSWGMCHEIGHNMQEGQWTFHGTTEVTNNLFCLFNYNKVWKLPYYGSEELKLYRDYDRIKDIKKYLDENAKFDIWTSEPFHALLIYAQMANHFGFGFFKEVFAYYSDNNLNPKTDSDKMNTWMNVTSRIVGQNLLPIFYFWGFPIDSEIEVSMKSLRCLFPEDFYREISEIRTKMLLKQNINTVISIPNILVIFQKKIFGLTLEQISLKQKLISKL